MNSYYSIQLLEHDKKHSYHVWRTWGRVGTTIGSNKLQTFRSVGSAMAAFEEVFHEKTGFPFSQRKSAQKVPGKFFPIEIQYAAPAPLPSASSSAVASKLDSRVQSVIKMIFDLETIKQAMMEMEIDLDQMPLGQLTRSHINKGFSVLTELQSVLGEMTDANDPTTQVKLLDLTNRFYSIIPHKHGIRGVQPLSTQEQLKQKITMMNTLLDIEVATSLLATSDRDMEEEINELDRHYRSLKCQLQPLEESDRLSLIKTYVNNTHAPTHSNYSLEVLDAFEVVREGEESRYVAMPNRMLLWHGSRLTNWAGILSQGLRIAPPEAPVTGYMFGKGVYFADMVSKSANYCFTSRDSNVGFLVLCEVSLGTSTEKLQADSSLSKATLPEGCQSTKGVGKTCPDPSMELTIEEDLKVPIGTPFENPKHKGPLLYNEFIVYDVSQVKMRYLVKVKFNYHR
eukprot:GILI01030730.1.p1 GENE.GILI01030730.1~~GILI01030730.1.p1  ORF type:complete len:526 (-),score=154.32 GILI01030730.1:282-1643(-)